MLQAAKKLSWPFMNGPEDSIHYAPLGRYGAIYSVPDRYAQYLIQLKYSAAYGTLWFTIVAIKLTDLFCHGRPWTGIEREMGSALFFSVILAYFAIVSCQSKGLKVASRRPSLLQCCQVAADQVPGWRLWAAQIVAILTTSLSISGLHNHSPISALMSGVYVALFIALPLSIALLCSYILTLRVCGKRADQAEAILTVKAASSSRLPTALELQRPAAVVAAGEEHRNWTAADSVQYVQPVEQR